MNYWCIVVQPHGWAVVGKIWDDGARAGFHMGCSIEKWGTEGGVGELQHSGPKEETITRPEGPVSWFATTAEIRRLPLRDPKVIALWKARIEKDWAEVPDSYKQEIGPDPEGPPDWTY